MSSWPSKNGAQGNSRREVKKLKCIVLGGANAGKTSILRKYFHGIFDSTRRPTVGSDFYTKKMADPMSVSNGNSESTLQDEKKETSPFLVSKDQKTMISIQVWDTPGRERFAANQTKPMYTAAFSDNFFKNADAGVLVYDVTSSTSFTHVLKWYEDLMIRIHRLEASGERTKPLPVLIVANKIDLSSDRDSHPSTSQEAVPQRDVMGLEGKRFRGKDSRYEYTTSGPPKEASTNSLASAPSTKKKKQRHRHELSTYMGTGDRSDYLQAVLSNDVQIGSYLESLLSTEDGSHPDKDMVLLWCKRNGLRHIEVSALDGTGIDELMSQVIEMAAEAAQSTSIPQPKNLPPQKSSSQQRDSHTTIALGSEPPRNQPYLNDELDLHQRYVPKDRPCFSLPFGFCCRP